MEYGASSEEVATILRDIAEDRPREGLAHPKMAVCEMPRIMYQPALHGRFLFDDYANFDPDLKANRVLVGSSRWESLVREHQGTEAILLINLWCEEHCASDFAWTTCGPIWTFRDHREAFGFRMAWT
jgi:hypothetical protein